jgi:hypothetical protein
LNWLQKSGARLSFGLGLCFGHKSNPNLRFHSPRVKWGEDRRKSVVGNPWSVAVQFEA